MPPQRMHQMHQMQQQPQGNWKDQLNLPVNDLESFSLQVSTAACWADEHDQVLFTVFIDVSLFY